MRSTGILGAFVLLLLSTWAAASSQDRTPDDAVVLEVGRHRFQWIRDWLKPGDGAAWGATHGQIVVDRAGLVYVNTETENAICVFRPDGKFVRGMGKELKGGLHGMVLTREGDREFLFVAHHGLHQVWKMTTDGEVVFKLDYPEKSGLYRSADQFKPTGVAVADSGEFFVADGYGLSYVHKYDAKGVYLASFGGAGEEPGKMRSPHGIWMDTRTATPRLMVADRENHRLQAFDLDGKLLSVVTGDFRRPSNFAQIGTDLFIADLEGRVTVIDKDDKVIGHIGDNPDPALRAQFGVPKEQWRDGVFSAPHSLRFDAEGNLYVMDWNRLGRVSKLQRLK